MPTRMVPDDIWRSYQADSIGQQYQGMVDDLTSSLHGALGLDQTPGSQESPSFARPDFPGYPPSPQTPGPPSPSSTSLFGGGLPSLDSLMAPFGGSSTSQQAAQTPDTSASAWTGGASPWSTPGPPPTPDPLPSLPGLGRLVSAAAPWAASTATSAATGLGRALGAGAPSGTTSQGGGAVRDAQITGGNKDDFLRTAGPIAAQVEQETGVPARLS